jgi:hypothetical protein
MYDKYHNEMPDVCIVGCFVFVLAAIAESDQGVLLTQASGRGWRRLSQTYPSTSIQPPTSRLTLNYIISINEIYTMLRDSLLSLSPIASQ